MSNTITVTLTPAGAITNGAKWCIVGFSNWLASGVSYTLAAGTYTISYKYVPGYATPANASITMAASPIATSGAYTDDAWLAAWEPPNAIAYFRGQVFTGGAKHTTPDSGASDARLVRWSEIGAFAFLGASADARKNTAGEFYIGDSDSEMVMRIMPMSDCVIVFGSYGVYKFEPVSQPAPTYKVVQLPTAGIKNPLAVGGFEKELLFVDIYGNLKVIAYNQRGEIEVKTIGYAYLLSTMQASMSLATGVGVISIVYNPDEDEYYVGTATKSYLYNKISFTEMDYAYTSYVNLNNTLLSSHENSAWTSKPMSSVTKILSTDILSFETEIIDFDIAGIKTIQSVFVQGTFNTTAVVEVMVKYRMNRSAALTSTSYVRCSPQGVAYPIVSGCDISICVKVTKCDDVYIDGIVVEWQLVDKHSVRGQYVNKA
jgi:hypothetical protein